MHVLYAHGLVLPVLTLAAWTFVMWIWMYATRIPAMQKAKIDPQEMSRTGAKLELRTDVVARTGAAKPYTAGHRLYGLVNDELLWTFDMAAMGHELQNHLAARLTPMVDDPAPGE